MTTSSRGSSRDLTAFYVAVVLIALTGQGLAAREWLGWPLPLALLAVAALEFGGVVLSRHALARMRLGERAGWARAGSAAVAGFAVAFNWAGHSNHMLGAFFALMSALGYGVWILDSNARRRDELRARSMLAAVPPAYGATRWMRHPVLTHEARALAIATPTLGLHGSIAAAKDARRRERRHAAIGVLLRRKLSQGKDEVAAELAIATYDMDEIAARLAAGADYDGLTALLAADLTAAAVAGVPDIAADTPADITGDAGQAADTVVTSTDTPAAQTETAGSDQSAVRLTTEQARYIAQGMYRANPDIALDIIADKIGRDVRTVRRYLEPLGRPTSGAPAIAAPQPPRMLGPDDALAALELGTVVDPEHRRHLAELALASGPSATEQAEQRAALARGERRSRDRVSQQEPAAAGAAA
ncbi:hypothetical protein ABT297_03920 [Dactylosporangium sp. NPDC000555]|uniref:hypothetical protein n=1 Tax=Dactylosporangium sp. NPDC000555 TaxID=3154260 RepID=UPI00332E830D